MKSVQLELKQKHWVGRPIGIQTVVWLMQGWNIDWSFNAEADRLYMRIDRSVDICANNDSKVDLMGLFWIMQ